MLDDVQNFGRWTREYLSLCGLEQLDLAREMETAEYNISRYLSGKRTPDSLFVFRILYVLWQRDAFEYPHQAREGLALLNMTPQELSRRLERRLLPTRDTNAFFKWLRRGELHLYRRQGKLKRQGREIASGQGIQCHIYDFHFTIRAFTSSLVGRSFVFEAVDDFMRTHSRGYFRIVAGPGLGKTTLAAALTNQRPTIPYFFDPKCGITHPERCLNHLCATLIWSYDLDVHCAGLPPRAGVDSAFLVELLERITSRAPLHKLVLVLDAIDEAQPMAAGRNWARLPSYLPQGAYIIVTQRPGCYPIYTGADTPVAELTIRWDDPRQQADVETYLRREVKRDGIQRALATVSPPIPEDLFVSRLQEASQGNFTYLHYVLGALSRSEMKGHPLDLENLPPGLESYYAQLWARMRSAESDERWYELYRPIVELLAAARGPVETAWLADHVDRDEAEVRERVLERALRPFLIRECRNGEATWRFFHWSFARFLADRIDSGCAHR